MPVDKSKYPADWPAISKNRREVVAGGRCEWIDAEGKRCTRVNGELAQGRKGKEYRIVLTVAHLDNDTTHNTPDNLRAWCQPHHLAYDAHYHAENAKKTRHKKRERSAIEMYGSDAPLFS